MHVSIRLEGVEARLQETSEAFEQSRTVAKKSKAEYELVKKMRYICVEYIYSQVHVLRINVDVKFWSYSDMTDFKMPLNMFQPSLMIFTRYDSTVCTHVYGVLKYMYILFVCIVFYVTETVQ